MKHLFTFTILTPFLSLVSFYSPWKYQKTRGFPKFPGGIEWNKCNGLNKVTRKKWRLVRWPRNIFRKTNISNPLTRTRTSAYQGVRNVSFSEEELKEVIQKLETEKKIDENVSDKFKTYFRKILLLSLLDPMYCYLNT